SGENRAVQKGREGAAESALEQVRPGPRADDQSRHCRYDQRGARADEREMSRPRHSIPFYNVKCLDLTPFLISLTMRCRGYPWHLHSSCHWMIAEQIRETLRPQLYGHCIRVPRRYRG